jgi:hypothetical protein
MTPAAEQCREGAMNLFPFAARAGIPVICVVMPMEVFNGGTTDLTALIMFVVDATKPFSVPAKFE